MRGIGDSPPTHPDADGDARGDALVRQARALADETRAAEDRAAALRRLRDRAIIQLIEHGWSTRRVGRALGLTATQISTIWNRTRPSRAHRPRAEREQLSPRDNDRA